MSGVRASTLCRLKRRRSTSTVSRRRRIRYERAPARYRMRRTTPRVRMVLAASFAAALGLASRGHTESPTATTTPATAERDLPCKAARDTYCRGVPRGGLLLACLQQHRDALPPECRARLDAAKKARAQPALGPRTFMACRTDLEKHCRGVPSGGGRLRACLRQHDGEISPRCRTSMDADTAAAPPAPTSTNPPTRR